MYKLEAGPGDHFSEVAKRAQRISGERTELVEFDFNGVKCIVEGRINYYNNRPNTDLDLLYRDYCNALTMGWETVGPNCVKEYDKKTRKAIAKKEAENEAERKQIQETYRKEQEAKDKSLDDKLEGIEMTFKDKELWDKGLENNKDAYGGAIYKYAERWAKLMQYEMQQSETQKIYDENGTLLKEIPLYPTVYNVAEKASHDADVEGITGFMYGAAVSVLSSTWEHGEELRKWHNGEYNHEGDGVVNPAILTIGKKEE